VSGEDYKTRSLCSTRLAKYYSGDQIKKEMVGARRDTYVRCEICLHDLVGRPHGKRPLGRSRHRGEDNIKIDLEKLQWGSVDWIDLAEDRERGRTLVNAVMNLRVP
jgi:hypothetical protein